MAEVVTAVAAVAEAEMAVAEQMVSAMAGAADEEEKRAEAEMAKAEMAEEQVVAKTAAAARAEAVMPAVATEEKETAEAEMAQEQVVVETAAAVPHCCRAGRQQQAECAAVLTFTAEVLPQTPRWRTVFLWRSIAHCWSSCSQTRLRARNGEALARRRPSPPHHRRALCGTQCVSATCRNAVRSVPNVGDDSPRCCHRQA